jgi:hypothetical protein
LQARSTRKTRAEKHVTSLKMSRVDTKEILGLEGESANEKWTINPCRQGKLDLGVIPADRLGCLLLNTFFWYLLNGVVYPCQLGLTLYSFG